MVHPAPLMKGLLSEEAACEDLASVLNMVSAGLFSLGSCVLLCIAAERGGGL